MNQTFGDLAAELTRERQVIQTSHLDDLRRQQVRLAELIKHTEHGQSADRSVRLTMNGHQQISQVWVSPMIIDQFHAVRFRASVREAIDDANAAVSATLHRRARQELGITPPATTDWPAQVRRTQEATRTMINTMRRLAPSYAARIEDALARVAEFQHATFRGVSAGEEITAIVDARGDVVDLVVDDVPRRDVDNRTFAGWLEAALGSALDQRAARQHQVSQFSLPSP